MAWGKKKVAQGWQVVVTGGPDVGWHQRVGEDPIQVGRAVASDIVLTEPSVSREHLCVYWHKGAIRCEDLGSTHGSYYQSPWRKRFKLPPRRIPVSLTAQDRSLHWRRRGKVTVGPHTLELVPDWRIPTGKKGGIPAEMLARFALPLVMGVAMIPLYARAGSGRMLMAFLFPLMMVVMVWATWRSYRKRKQRENEPDVVEPSEITPARLGALSRRNPPPASRAWETGNALAHARELEPLAQGSSIALVGEDALSFGRWILCQWAVFSNLDEWTFQARLAEHAAEIWLKQLPHYGPHVVLLMDSLSARTTPPATQTTCLVVCRTIADVPSWCSEVVQVTASHDRQISHRFATHMGRELAHRSLALALPTDVPFIPEFASALTAGDSSAGDSFGGDLFAGNSLATEVGLTAEGPAIIDLVADGPHALVAGTTGSGKSEFLTIWLLGICARYSPASVGLILIDYKGGATFGALENIAHSLGVVTDLSAGLTARVLASLHAELKRRETELASIGARSIQEAPHLGRLIIVVDEFRIMATEHPDFLDSLVRLAAQGRSLGMHLILATQRPGGIVQADVQANISLRVCFQVRDESDSIDVLGTTAAARLPAVPGRGMIASEESFVFQSAYAGEQVSSIVAKINKTWQGYSQLSRPWAPPLPQVLDLAHTRSIAEQFLSESTDIARGGITSHRDTNEESPDGPGVLAGLLDDPHHQVVRPWFVAERSALIVQGPVGLSNTCRVIAHSALAAGLQVGVVTQDPPWPLHAHMGACLDPAQPETVCFFVDQLLAGALETPPDLLIIDDADVFIAQVDQMNPGHGITVLRSLMDARRRLGFTLIVASRSHGDRLAQWADTRFIISPRDSTTAQLAGVERSLTAGPFVPGRGVLMAPGTQLIGQVPFMPPATPIAQLSHHGQRRTFTRLPTAAAAPVEILNRSGGTGRPIALGVGVQGPAVPVLIELQHTLAIVGTRGSGRTTALELFTCQLTLDGYEVWRSIEEAEAALPAQNESGGSSKPDSRRGVLVLDDLTTQSARAIQVPDNLPIIAAVGSELLAHPFPGVATRLAHAKSFLFLGNPAHAHTICNEPIGTYLPLTLTPGRGVLVQNKTISPVQVYGP